jgi:hypothetical protein
MRRFVETLDRQNIEMFVTEEDSKLTRARSAAGGEAKNVVLPKGTVIVPLDQPLRALIEVILEFDIRMPTKFLEYEREELLRNKGSKLYEVTAWSLPLGYNLECYFSEKLPKVGMASTADVTNAQKQPRGLVGDASNFGYVIDIVDDGSYLLLARLFERDCKVWSAKKPFEVDGHSYPRGSLLIKRSGNPELDETELAALARGAGVDVHRVGTALATTGVDLGGGQFALLQTPRIGVVGGSTISTTGFGSLWHLIDNRLQYGMSTLDVSSVVWTDLRKYNVIVLPAAWGGAGVYKRALGESGIKKLKSWVEQGGTLVAMGAATEFLADSSVALSSVRPRRQVLSQLDEYDRALEQVKAALTPEVDSLALWEGPQDESSKKDADKKSDDKDKAATKGKRPKDKKALKEADEMARRFSPHGAILAVDLDDTHWLAFGARSPMPVMVYSSYAFLAKSNVKVAGRYAAPEKIRLSGLLWPEARCRWSETVYATSERRGNGQVVLFAGYPDFRGYFHGSERLLLNALFLGPGFGTNQVFY